MVFNKRLIILILSYLIFFFALPSFFDQARGHGYGGSSTSHGAPGVGAPGHGWSTSTVEKKKPASPRSLGPPKHP